MITNDLSTCKKCLSDFPTSELIWGDKGGMYFVCLDCYAQPSVALCGDCLYPIDQCEHGREFRK